MKKIIAILAVAHTLCACQSDDLSKYVYPEYTIGDFVLMDEIKTPVLNYGTISEGGDPEYSFVLTKVAGNAKSWMLKAALLGANSADQGSIITTVDITALKAYEKKVVIIKASDIARSWEKDLSIFAAGDQILFEATIIGSDGKEIATDNLSKDLLGNAGPKQGLKWSTYLSCAFDAAASAGTYKVVEDGWGDWSAGEEMVVEANAGGTGIIVKGMYSKKRNNDKGPYDVEVKVDAKTGVASVAKQGAWEYSWYDAAGTYGKGSVEGKGFVFSCAGTIVLTLEHTVTAGSFGDYKLVLKKG